MSVAFTSASRKVQMEANAPTVIFDNYILKRWLYRVGPTRRCEFLRKLRDELQKRGLQGNEVRHGLLQLATEPRVVLRRTENNLRMRLKKSTKEQNDNVPCEPSITCDKTHIPFFEDGRTSKNATKIDVHRPKTKSVTEEHNKKLPKPVKTVIVHKDSLEVKSRSNKDHTRDKVVETMSHLFDTELSKLDEILISKSQKTEKLPAAKALPATALTDVSPKSKNKHCHSEAGSISVITKTDTIASNKPEDKMDGTMRSRSKTPELMDDGAFANTPQTVGHVKKQSIKIKLSPKDRKKTKFLRIRENRKLMKRQKDMEISESDTKNNNVIDKDVTETVSKKSKSRLMEADNETQAAVNSIISDSTIVKLTTVYPEDCLDNRVTCTNLEENVSKKRSYPEEFVDAPKEAKKAKVFTKKRRKKVRGKFRDYFGERITVSEDEEEFFILERLKKRRRKKDSVDSCDSGVCFSEHDAVCTNSVEIVKEIQKAVPDSTVEECDENTLRKACEANEFIEDSDKDTRKEDAQNVGEITELNAEESVDTRNKTENIPGESNSSKIKETHSIREDTVNSTNIVETHQSEKSDITTTSLIAEAPVVEANIEDFIPTETKSVSEDQIEPNNLESTSLAKDFSEDRDEQNNETQDLMELLQFNVVNACHITTNGNVVSISENNKTNLTENIIQKCIEQYPELLTVLEPESTSSQCTNEGATSHIDSANEDLNTLSSGDPNNKNVSDTNSSEEDVITEKDSLDESTTNIAITDQSANSELAQDEDVEPNDPEANDEARPRLRVLSSAELGSRWCPTPMHTSVHMSPECLLNTNAENASNSSSIPEIPITPEADALTNTSPRTSPPETVSSSTPQANIQEVDSIIQQNNATEIFNSEREADIRKAIANIHEHVKQCRWLTVKYNVDCNFSRQKVDNENNQKMFRDRMSQIMQLLVAEMEKIGIVLKIKDYETVIHVLVRALNKHLYQSEPVSYEEISSYAPICLSAVYSKQQPIPVETVNDVNSQTTFTSLNHQSGGCPVPSHTEAPVIPIPPHMEAPANQVPPCVEPPMNPVPPRNQIRPTTTFNNLAMPQTINHQMPCTAPIPNQSNQQVKQPNRNAMSNRQLPSTYIPQTVADYHQAFGPLQPQQSNQQVPFKTPSVQNSSHLQSLSRMNQRMLQTGFAQDFQIPQRPPPPSYVAPALVPNVNINRSDTYYQPNINIPQRNSGQYTHAPTSSQPIRVHNPRHPNDMRNVHVSNQLHSQAPHQQPAYRRPSDGIRSQNAVPVITIPDDTSARPSLREYLQRGQNVQQNSSHVPSKQAVQPMQSNMQQAECNDRSSLPDPPRNDPSQSAKSAQKKAPSRPRVRQRTRGNINLNSSTKNATQRCERKKQNVVCPQTSASVEVANKQMVCNISKNFSDIQKMMLVSHIKSYFAILKTVQVYMAPEQLQEATLTSRMLKYFYMALDANIKQSIQSYCQVQAEVPNTTNAQQETLPGAPSKIRKNKSQVNKIQAKDSCFDEDRIDCRPITNSTEEHPKIVSQVIRSSRDTQMLEKINIVDAHQEEGSEASKQDEEMKDNTNVHLTEVQGVKPNNGIQGNKKDEVEQNQGQQNEEYKSSENNDVPEIPDQSKDINNKVEDQGMLCHKESKLPFGRIEENNNVFEKSSNHMETGETVTNKSIDEIKDIVPEEVTNNDEQIEVMQDENVKGQIQGMEQIETFQNNEQEKLTVNEETRATEKPESVVADIVEPIVSKQDIEQSPSALNIEQRSIQIAVLQENVQNEVAQSDEQDGTAKIQKNEDKIQEIDSEMKEEITTELSGQTNVPCEDQSKDDLNVGESFENNMLLGMKGMERQTVIHKNVAPTECQQKLDTSHDSLKREEIPEPRDLETRGECASVSRIVNYVTVEISPNKNRIRVVDTDTTMSNGSNEKMSTENKLEEQEKLEDNESTGLSQVSSKDTDSEVSTVLIGDYIDNQISGEENVETSELSETETEHDGIVPIIANVESITLDVFNTLDGTPAHSGDPQLLDTENRSVNITFDNEKEVTEKCLHCNETSTVVCEICLAAYYCSKRCSDLHWGEHYKICKPHALYTKYKQEFIENPTSSLI